MKPEQSLWQLIKPYIPGHVERVENTSSTGTPDVMWCWDGKVRWLELKVSKAPDVADFRPSQKVWHLKHTSEGGRVFALFRCGDTLLLYKVCLKSRTETQYAEVWKGTKPWNWQQFQDILRTL